MILKAENWGFKEFLVSNRYTQYKDRMKRLYVVPKYEPVLVEPSMKEYETQVR